MKVYINSSVNIFGRRFALCYGNVVLSVLSVCDVAVIWPNGWTDQDATYGTEVAAARPRPRPQYVRWNQTPQ